MPRIKCKCNATSCGSLRFKYTNYSLLYFWGCSLMQQAAWNGKQNGKVSMCTKVKIQCQSFQRKSHNNTEYMITEILEEKRLKLRKQKGKKVISSVIHQEKVKRWYYCKPTCLFTLIHQENRRTSKRKWNRLASIRYLIQVQKCMTERFRLWELYLLFLLKEGSPCLLCISLFMEWC